MPKSKCKTTAKAATARPLERLSERTGRVLSPARSRGVRARYDAATVTDENRVHFAVADGLSPDALANAEVRRKLRNWTRYEVRNNSWAKGIRDTISNDTVGTGPQLQMQTGTPIDDVIELDFADWAKEIRLAEKLRTMRAGRADSGEVFGLLATNPGLASDVKLDLMLKEAEQVVAPTSTFDNPVTESDGIEFDQWGNPERYHILRVHPGSMMLWTVVDDSDWWPAKSVLHYYRPDRPGQKRGVPDFTPAVQLFAELRRYCAAVIAAAETAADYAAVLYSDQAPDPESGSTEVSALDQVELVRRMAVTLPQGYKLGQIHAEQPVTTYSDFVDKKLSEICRCLNVPFTIGALDSSKANMSAAYLDHQTYAKAIGIDRADLTDLLDRVLDAWLTEWILVNRDFINLVERVDRFFHQWFWPSLGNHADPGKVANARATNLSSGLTTIPREYARDGLDWVSEQESDAKSMGITVEDLQKLILLKRFGPPPAPAPAPTDETEPENDDEDEPKKQEQARTRV